MATGDSAGAARAVASTVGLEPEHVHAALLPADKLQKVLCPCSPVEYQFVSPRYNVLLYS